MSYSNEGNHNLEVIHNATKFTDWMYSEIKPHLQSPVLEVGGGIGTYSEKVARDFDKFIVTDIDKKYVKNLASKLGVEARRLDLMKKEDYKIKGVRSVFALNVLEHIEDDLLVLQRMYNLLEKGGRFVVLVPAHKWLFNCMDEAVDHYRRYNKKTMRELVAKTDFTIKKMWYFNFFAIPGWVWNGHILKKTELGSGLMKVFNALVPVFSFIEKYVFFKKLGISLIVVLEKK